MWLAIGVRQWGHTPLIPALGSQRQTELCEFNATLGYTKLIQSKIETEPSGGVAHNFNPSTREVEMGRDMAGQREEYKVGGDGSSTHSVRGL